MTKIIRKALSEITVPDGRNIDYVKVSELAESIKIVGRLLNPITIRKDGTIVAGLHRFEACKLLGFDEIDCIVLDGEEWQIELAEIDENLVRRELDPISRGKLALRRDEILDAQGLRAKAGQGRPSKNGADSAPLKTTEVIAKEAGVSERALQEDKQIARALVPKAVEAVEMIKAPKRDMLKLSRKNHEDQEGIAKQILDCGATTVQEAMSAVLAELSDAELNDRIKKGIEEGKHDGEAVTEQNRRRSKSFDDAVRVGKYDSEYCKKHIRKITKASEAKDVAMKELQTLFLETLGWEKSQEDKESLIQLLDSEIRCSKRFTDQLEALRAEFVPGSITSISPDNDDSGDISESDDIVPDITGSDMDGSGAVLKESPSNFAKYIRGILANDQNKRVVSFDRDILPFCDGDRVAAMDFVHKHGFEVIDGQLQIANADLVGGSN